MKNQIKELYKKNKKLVWFLIGVFILKIILSGLFSSDYQDLMFKPFINNFLEGVSKGNFNPYQSWYLKKTGYSFPYQFIMVIIESFGMLLIKLFNIKSVFLSNLLFKIPLLIFDVIGMIFLFKIFPRRKKEISILYYTSPIIIYGTFIHSQLDIIPISILIVSMYFLIKGDPKKNILFAIFLGLSIMTKHSILTIVPILFIYLYKKNGLLSMIKSAVITFGVILLLSLPFISTGYVNNVLFNQNQNVILNVFIKYGDVRVYVSLITLIAVYLNAFVVGSMNKDLLFGYCAMGFAAFLALVPPMPGWFIWIIPFMVSILANSKVKNKEKVIIIYHLFSFMYIVYMIFCHHTAYTDIIFLNSKLSFLKIKNVNIINIVFTIFISVLLYIIYILYKNGLESNALYKRRSTPFTIGITGDSGSGKSTLVNSMKNMFDVEKMLLIEGDGDHKWERNEKYWEQYTHLNPKANYLYRQAQNIEELRNGRKVYRVDYNHETGKFSKEYQIKQKRYILLNGLHTLYLPQLRKSLDLKIYIDTDENLKKFWKIRRDTESRGYSVDAVLKSIEKRDKDYKKYVYPQINYADLVISYFDEKLVPKKFGTKYKEKISLKFILSSAIDLEPIVSQLEDYGIYAHYDFSPDLEKQTIIFDYKEYENANINFDKILNNVISEPEELSINTQQPKNNQEGLIKLILIGIINQKLIERE